MILVTDKDVLNSLIYPQFSR